MRVFLINGPPGSGKDSAGQMLAQMLGDKTVVTKFAAPVKMAAHAVMAILGKSGKVEASDHYEASKDEANEDFFGATPRAAYIQMSEGYCKPLFGKDIFGKLVLKEIENLKAASVENLVITDCGFNEEVQVLVDALGLEDIRLIVMGREGCSYEGDSRASITIPGLVPYHITNNQAPSQLRVAVAQYIATLPLEVT